MSPKPKVDKLALDLPAELRVFARRAQRLKKVLPVVESFLKEGLKALGVSDGIVKGRVKQAASVAGKLRKKEQDPDYRVKHPRLDVMTDLLGVRVLLPAPADVRRVSDWLLGLDNEGIWIDWENRRQDAQALKEDTFGYRSEHVIIALDGNHELWSRLPAPLRKELARKGAVTGAPVYRLEVQLRTFAAHAWAIMAHDQFYKTEGGRPRDLLRSAATAAALLETADRELDRLAGEVRIFESSVLSIRSAKSIQRELDYLGVVAGQLPAPDPGLALRCARLHRSLGNWKEALKALSPCGNHPGAAAERVGLLALQAIDKSGGKPTASDADKVFKALKAAAPGLQSSEDFCEVAEALLLLLELARKQEEHIVLDYANQALRLEPRSPRAFRSYLIASVVESADAVRTIRLLAHPLEQALSLSLERARQQVYVPWAYFDAALFTFLKHVSDQHESKRPPEPAGALLECYDLLLRGIELWRCPLEKAGVRRIATTAPSPYPLLVFRRLLSSLHGCLGEYPLQELQFMQDLLSLALHVHGHMPSATRRKDLPHTSIPKRKPGQRLVILAGACAAELENLMSEHCSSLTHAFKEYAGVVVSGGTKSGISGIAAGLGNPARVLRRGYVQVNRPFFKNHWDEKKDLVHVQELASTPCEPLNYWRDALQAGYHPSDEEHSIRLLGVDGGPVSAFEYKLAIALGARTGIIEDNTLLEARGTGRASAWKAITGDPLWSTAPNFMPLPKDPAIPYMFLRMPAKPWPEDANLRETLAKMSHDNYRKVVLHRPGTIDPTYGEWDKLKKGDWQQKSSHAQVASLRDRLAAVSLYIFPENKKAPLLRSGEYEEAATLDEGDIELLARTEHARWCIERLDDGWRHGPKRDDENRLRPQLVDWDTMKAEQDPIEIEKDLAVARGVGEMLSKLNEGKVRYVLLKKKSKP